MTPKRKKIFFFRGFQLRYASLVSGSLLVLLIFSVGHSLFMLQSYAPVDASSDFIAHVHKASMRLLLVGLLYIIVVTLAAIFISHRTVGPAYRIEQEIRDITQKDQPHPLHIRAGDEFEGLVGAINELLEKAMKLGKK